MDGLICFGRRVDQAVLPAGGRIGENAGRRIKFVRGTFMHLHLLPTWLGWRPGRPGARVKRKFDVHSA
jgi:hypothetical protein